MRSSLNTGDLVTWVQTSKQDYFDGTLHLGIFLSLIETYDHWILANVLDHQGNRQVVMLQKELNPV